jgi:ribonuclease P protein component
VVLPAARRLRHRAEFSDAVRQGKRAAAHGLVVHLSSSDMTTAPARAGFVVGKVVGPAVVRNRVRRRLRHLVAARLDLLQPGTLLVVRATPPAAAASYAELADALDRGLDRVNRVPA